MALGRPAAESKQARRRSGARVAVVGLLALAATFALPPGGANGPVRLAGPVEVPGAPAPSLEGPIVAAPGAVPSAPVPTPPTTLPDLGPQLLSGSVPPPTFLLVTPAASYASVPERSVVLEGTFEFAYEQFGQTLLAFAPAPGTLTTWKLFTVLLYDRDQAAPGGGTALDALLSDLVPGTAASVEIPVLPDPTTEAQFVGSTVLTTDVGPTEARAKYERMLLSNREPLLGVGVGSYLVTSSNSVIIAGPPS